MQIFFKICKTRILFQLKFNLYKNDAVFANHTENASFARFRICQSRLTNPLSEA
jgi:hypothetical protein